LVTAAFALFAFFALSLAAVARQPQLRAILAYVSAHGTSPGSGSKISRGSAAGSPWAST
jgi:hypothetical protein